MARARPNIVMILADDMGYGDIGCFGNPLVRTPALDRLSSEGMRLTQCYAGSPVCAPSRAAMMTGRYPHRTGAIDTLEGRGLDRLALRERTIADILKDSGYVTGLIGKWHLGALDPRYHPNRRGFDEFLGFRGGWSDYWQWNLDANGRHVRADGRYLTDVFSEAAVDFVHRHAREAFFLHVTYNAPHFPLQVPDDEATPFRELGNLKEGVCRIYGMNMNMDRGVERILDSLHAHGVAENTLVLFTSDNGPAFGVYNGLDQTRYNGVFNGCKGLTYEGGIRVPAILRWPAGIPGAGVRTDAMVHFTDWLPTLASAAGVSLPASLCLDGQDVLPSLRGERGMSQPARFWQWNRYTPVRSCNAALREGPWKLIRPTVPAAMHLTAAELDLDRRLKYDPASVKDINREPLPVPNLPEETPAPLLFDLDMDPGEKCDLAGVEPTRLDRMQNDLDHWFDSVEADRRSIRD